MTVEEQEIFSNYLLNRTLEEEPYRNVFLFQMYMGLRVGEALALKQSDIDFEKQRIKIRRTLTIDKDGTLKIGQKTKTYAGTRDIPMQKFLLPYILEQYEQANENKDNYLFLYSNRLINHSTINGRLQRILKNLDIYKKGMSSHALRHTFGTRCIEGGMTPVALQRLMGHTDIKITLNTYTSVFNEFKESELEKISSYYEEKHFLNSLSNKKRYLSNDEMER